jgi:[1-hydroxy-2-(trimethylamino)ethyl]phosphonate dioxygenase
MNSNMNPLDTIFNLFATKGHAGYFGERVSELEHGLQSAHLAEKSGASAELIVAALLHDIGHLLHGLPENIADQGIDARHEQEGAHWLRRHFGPAVIDPVRLHVEAKRYLCVREPTYLATLSPASRRSLQLQGGPLDAIGMQAFANEPHASDALALRHWDDEAKIPNLQVPELEHYRSMIRACLLPKAGTNDEAI